MKGYFSRLIRQTGIALEPVTGPASGVALQPTADSSERGYTAPIHVEEERLIEPKRERNIESVSEDAEGGFVDASRIRKSGDIERSRQDGFETNFTEEPQTHNSDFEKPKQENRRSETGEEGRKISDTDTQPLGVEAPRHKTGAGELPDVEGTVEVRTAGKEDSKELSKPVAHPITERRESTAFTPRAEPGDNVNPEQSWRDYLYEIRKWVAEGTPAAEGDDSFKAGDRGRMPGSPDEERISASPYPAPREPRKMTEEPEVDDFHLSIGTISLTIEEPQKQVQNKHPAQTRESASRRREGESRASRLGRHYIKIK